MTRPLCISLLFIWIGIANAQHTVVINEVMYAPKSPEPEWVELFNFGSDSVSLKSWRLSDKVKSYTLPSVILAPDHFLILCSDTNQLKAKYDLGNTVLIQGSLPTFNNDGDLIVLKDSSGIVVDSFIYSTVWGGSNGASLERIDAEASSDALNYSTSIADSGATPGAANSIRRRDNDIAATSIRLLSQNGTTLTLGLVFLNKGKFITSSIQYSLFKKGSILPLTTGVETAQIIPLAFDTILFSWTDADLGVADLIFTTSYTTDENIHNDTIASSLDIPIPSGSVILNEFMITSASGSCQWIELYNRSASTIQFQNSNLLIYQQDTVIRIQIDSLHIVPKGFGIVSASDKILTSYSSLHSSDPIFIVGKTGTLHLPENGSSISLTNSTLSVIDSTYYDLSYYSPNLSSPAGISLERKQTEGNSTDKNNWGSCVAELGATPLALNSLSFANTNTTPSAELTITPNPFSPDGDDVDDVTVLTLDLPNDDEAVFSIKVYDSRGRLVRSLSNHHRVVRSSSMEFNGKDDHQVPLPIGVYTVVIEPIVGNIQGIRAGVVIAKK